MICRIYLMCQVVSKLSRKERKILLSFSGVGLFFGYLSTFSTIFAPFAPSVARGRGGVDRWRRGTRKRAITWRGWCAVRSSLFCLVMLYRAMLWRLDCVFSVLVFCASCNSTGDGVQFYEGNCFSTTAYWEHISDRISTSRDAAVSSERTLSLRFHGRLELG